MLRIEFEQNLAANEQTGPINKEMRNLITSLQTHNVQLKGEVARFKRKFKEKEMEITKLRKENDDLKEAEIKALQAKKEALLSAVGEGSANVKEEIKEETKDSVETGVKLEAAPAAGGEGAGEAGAGGDGEVSAGAVDSPDSGPSSEGAKLDLKGKTDQAKIAELQKVKKN